jgi:polysaccharide export outer membrane protein
MIRAVVYSIVLVVLGACAHDPKTFVWVDEFKDDAAVDNDYIIRPGDLVNVRVFGQEAMSTRSRVRNDGKITMPFLNDLTAAGYTPVVLSAQLQTRLKDFINNPVVTTSLEEIRPVPVSILGEVPKPGIYTLDPSSGMLQALAAAGGFTNFARKNLFLLRAISPSGEIRRVRFDYEKLTRAEGKGSQFRLRPNDVLIVE